MAKSLGKMLEKVGDVLQSAVHNTNQRYLTVESQNNSKEYFFYNFIYNKIFHFLWSPFFRFKKRY